MDCKRSVSEMQLNSKGTNNYKSLPQLPGISVGKLTHTRYQDDKPHQSSQSTLLIPKILQKQNNQDMLQRNNFRQSVDNLQLPPQKSQTSRNQLQPSVGFISQYQLNHDFKQNTLKEAIQKYATLLPLILNNNNNHEGQPFSARDPFHSQFISSPLWNGKNTQFSESYRQSGMFQINTMQKIGEEKAKFQKQKQRLKDLLERHRNELRESEDKAALLNQYRELYNGKVVLQEDKLMKKPLQELQVRYKKAQINQIIVKATLKIQSGWRMHKAKVLYQKMRRQFLFRITKIQRVIRQQLLKNAANRKRVKAAIAIQSLYRGFKARRSIVQAMGLKVNSNLQCIQDIRKRVYNSSVCIIAKHWRQRTLQIMSEKKKNAYKCFIIKSIQVFQKHKKIKDKTKVPRYMQNLKRVNQGNTLNTSNISQNSKQQIIGTKPKVTPALSQNIKPNPATIKQSSKQVSHQHTLTKQATKEQDSSKKVKKVVEESLQVPMFKAMDSLISKISSQNSTPNQERESPPNKELSFNNDNSPRKSVIFNNDNSPRKNMPQVEEVEAGDDDLQVKQTTNFQKNYEEDRYDQDFSREVEQQELKLFITEGELKGGATKNQKTSTINSSLAQVFKKVLTQDQQDLHEKSQKSPKDIMINSLDKKEADKKTDIVLKVQEQIKMNLQMPQRPELHELQEMMDNAQDFNIPTRRKSQFFNKKNVESTNESSKLDYPVIPDKKSPIIKNESQQNVQRKSLINWNNIDDNVKEDQSPKRALAVKKKKKAVNPKKVNKEIYDKDQVFGKMDF